MAAITVNGRRVVVVGQPALRRARRVPMVAAAVCLAVLVGLATVIAESAPSTRPLLSRHSLQSHPKANLPISLAPAVSASIGASEHSSWPLRHGASLLTHGGGINTNFTAVGPVLHTARGTLGLSLTAVGRGGRLGSIAGALPTATRNQVIYSHGSISEFYRNGPYGLEQGFTLRHRPEAGARPLVLALRLGGSLIPRQVGSQILFSKRGGSTALQYGQLSAADAVGRSLPARVEVRQGILRLLIDDRSARYPLRIDPFIQQGEKLTGSGEVGKGEFGESVALSSNGNTALIGGPLNGTTEAHGAAWVFTRSGSTWTQQAELKGKCASHAIHFGTSVALSADGNTALVGENGSPYCENGGEVFTRSGSEWKLQQVLTGEPGHELGQSVALSANGNTALIGGPEASEGVGSAWVFTRSGSTWTQQGSQPLKGSGEVGKGWFGYSVALSAEGNLALIGAPRDNSEAGSVWVFTRSGSVWTQTEKLTGSGETGGYFGDSVALSGEGNTALIGERFGPSYSSYGGAAWVFTRSGSTWTQQGEKLTGSGETGNGSFGDGAALSSDGNTAMIGGSYDNEGRGAGWIFTRSGSTWTQQGAKLTGSEETGSYFGHSVALSGEGNTALIGGPGAKERGGAAWVFIEPPPAVVSGAASALTPTSATLNASVNPNGMTVGNCHFEYGTTSAYGSSVSCASAPGSGESPVAVSASITGLAAHTTYHFRIVATNAGGTSEGADQTFATLPNPPTVATEAPSLVTQTSAKLNASVNPEGAEVSNCHFEYGTTTAYGSNVSCSSLPGSGENPVVVSASITGLAANTTYHFRIVATNSGGTSQGADQPFTTLPDPPTVVTGAASSVTQNSAALNATVNPNGGTVGNCHFEYGTTTAYGSSVSCASLPGSGESPVAVSASVTGLAAHTTYDFRIVATNSGGTSYGSDQSFTTGPKPTAVTEAASSVAQSSATLNATVNPNGAEVTNCHFEYGTTTSYGTSLSCASLPGSGESPVAVSASVTGLAANTIYHFRVVATNSGGTSQGSDQSFKTVPNAPTVASGAASSVTQSAATLNATVNPNGAAVSSCEFQYGTTTSYGSSVSCASLPGSGESPVAVSASIEGLSKHTTYHFRVVAANAGGTSEGADQTFTTGPKPTVVTEAASLITQTSATLNATVNPNGGAVSNRFEYGTTTSYGSSAPCASLPGSGESPVAVSALVAGLSANTTYHFRIVAANSGGTSYGTDQTVTTLPAPAQTPQGPGVPQVSPAPLPLLESQLPPVPDVTLVSTSLAASASGVVKVKVSCPAGESICTGKVTLRTLAAMAAAANGRKSNNRKAILTLAHGPFTVAGGQTTAVVLHLTAQARALLARMHVVRARATLVAHDLAGTTSSTQMIVKIRLKS